jgi:NADPH:quinone reductase-like Zn-dependent oxidoreductase
VNFNLREHPGASSFLEALSAAIDAGRLQVVIDAEFSLEKAPAAIASRGLGGARGKTVVAI